MRTIVPLIAASTLIFMCIFSCKHTKNSTKIKANVVGDTASYIQDSTIILIDDAPETAYDTLQKEFAFKLNVPYDSINDLRLYKFIKVNLGKKCFGAKGSQYTCESFLAKLIKNVYDIDFPNTIAEQMKYKNVELFKNTNFLQQGDILFFNYSNKQKDKISHAGFYLQNGFMVIATYNEGVVLTKFQNGFWNKRFIAAGRYIKFSSRKKIVK
jgi:NlpC/P60 family